MQSAKTEIDVEEYKVLFEHDDFPASGSSCVHWDGTLAMTVQKASDAEKGISTSYTESSDMGQSWSTPVPFGPPLQDPDTEFQGVGLAHVVGNGTIVAVGVHLSRGYDSSKGPESLYRPCEALIGFRHPGSSEFVWSRYASGTFMDEQFVAPGLQTSSGRLILTIWGSRRQAENWRCGVLLSDDDGKTLRYRDVGYQADLSIRNKPKVPAGYNEQTLFELPGDRIVSVIRGRDHLGEYYGASRRSSDALFSRSISQDGGETWSEPELTNLLGTGAPSDGLALPDGSLLMPARMPSSWSRWDDHSLCGLHMARSYDAGLSWETELVFMRDPEGNTYDNYYNAMNGTFVRLSDNRAMYVFGQFDKQRNRHRVDAVTLRWS